MGLRENIQTDAIAQLPLREVIKVKPSTPVREVAEKMRRKKLGCVILVDAKGRPVGKFTERKLMRVLLDGVGLDCPVEQYSYGECDCVALTDPIHKLAQLMLKKKLRFICVVDSQGRAVGLTGQKSLMEYIAEQFPRLIKAQRDRGLLSMDEREGA